MKVEYINPFLKSTVDTFKTMVNLAVAPGKIYLFKNGDNADVYGVVNISGSIEGAVIMAYPKATAMQISSKFLGEEVHELNATVFDCLGEIANIITGFAKKDLQALHLVISLPNVVQSRNSIELPKNVPVVCIPFESEVGNFTVEVCYS